MLTPFVLSKDMLNGLTCESHTLRVQHDIFLSKTVNPTHKPVQIAGKLSTDYVQIYVANKGGSRFSFYQGTYQKDLEKNQSLLFFNPKEELNYRILLAPQTKLLTLCIPIQTLHGWLSAETEEIYFQKKNHVRKKYYASKALTPALKWVVGQLFNLNYHGKGQGLYAQAKIMEMVSLYFSQGTEPDAGKCPFLQNERNARKIKQAKEILLDRYDNPPGLEELAKEIGLNTSQLKSGFKNMYGNTVHKYLTDHRMDCARDLLDTGDHRVNEVGYQIGYTSTSYFISAFKKKFGITPKKYLQGK